jgi:hypothetical protein
MPLGLLLILFALAATPDTAFAQKGTAEPDWYPLGYDGATWTGEVTAFDNDRRTLTLTNGSGKKAETFVATIPDAPYEWARDGRKSRVLDFPYDKNAKSQTFTYTEPGRTGSAFSIVPDTGSERTDSGRIQRPNPPESNVINDFSDSKGRRVTVYYVPREHEESGAKVKYNDVWRIRVIPTANRSFSTVALSSNRIMSVCGVRQVCNPPRIMPT